MGFVWTGLSDFRGDLRRVRDRLENPKLSTVADRALDVQRRNLQQPGRLGSWPPLSAATRENRRRLGFPAGPPLTRTGSLLGELQVLDVGAKSAEVGIEDDGRAAALDRDRPFIGFLPGDAAPVLDPFLDEVFS